jgi:hypothetical protein
VSEGKKIQYKIILARTVGKKKKDLLASQKFDELPLELMPNLLEFVQQEFGYNGFGKEVLPTEMPRNLEEKSGSFDYLNGLTREYVHDGRDVPLPACTRSLWLGRAYLFSSQGGLVG